MHDENIFRKILRYLTNDLVDLIYLMLFISVLIRIARSGFSNIDELVLGCIAINCLYVLGLIWRMGAAKDVMNEFTTDESVRKALGMNPYQMRYRPIRRSVIDWIFRIIFILGSVFIFVTQIILK